MYESFDDYKGYMEENKDKFPSHVFEFATDVNRHHLDSPHSLHDSWMTSVIVRENRNPERPFDPEPTIEIELLGQKHDRSINLSYSGIERYTIEGLKNPYNWGDTYQGDISCHEVRLSAEGFLIHEILFVSESKITIVCKDFQCSERLHT
ncbi:hypothetical protein [Zooshikella ganghwensis]|uniref:Uncharacterized protein n=1 Tax=Zooshikella ganghwensis TaxID=202772 RepID=A0A4P9VT82_9GAMM|nr:hypothetical protein [Zooshikella ganghwensis]RDH45634.1 hypothetical protein B9G39_20470 [Zooshikella ganghwensis]